VPPLFERYEQTRVTPEPVIKMDCTLGSSRHIWPILKRKPSSLPDNQQVPKFYPVSNGSTAEEAVDRAIERYNRKHGKTA